MRRRVIWVLVAAIAVGSAAVLGAAALDTTDQPVVIGTVFNTTGGLKWLDEPAVRGMLLAADQLNEEGGVLDRPIELVETDGTTDVVRMTDLAGQLAVRDDLVAIAGVTEPLHAVAPVRATIKRADGGFLTFSHSETAVAIGEVAQRNGVPFVSVGSTLGTLPERVGDQVFSMAATSEDGARAIARFAWEDLGGRHAWVLVEEGSAYAAALAAAFEATWEEQGGDTSGDDFRPGAVIQITDQIARLQALDPQPDVIFLAALQNDGGYLLDQLRESGIGQPVLFADVVDPRYIEAMGGDMQDVFMSTHGSLDSDDDDVRRFVTAYAERYGTEPESPSAMLGYDTLRLIADAIERAGASERDEVRDAIAATKGFEGLTGSLSYRHGVPARSITVVAYTDRVPEVVAEIDPG